MATTWFDIKLRTMQKMFASKGNEIPNDTSSIDYLAAMPGACNEALQRLATAGKFIIKSIQIAHNPIRNLLTYGERLMSSEGEAIEISASDAKSLYVEVLGNVTMTTYLNGDVVDTEVIASKAHYTPIKRLIANEEAKTVAVKFTSNYPFAIKNFALYGATFEEVNDIPPFSEVCKYDLSELADSFYMLTDDPIIYEGSELTARYMQSSDYFEEGGRVLVINRDLPGNFTIYYRAYPQKITSSTPDDYVLEVDPEVEALIPLYMASQIYKDDDNGIATVYRNEFEVGLQSLRDAVPAPSGEVFTSESGWI